MPRDIVLPDQPHDSQHVAALLNSLPRWQRVLILRINAGEELDTARGRGSRAVSLASIEDAKDANPAFARLLEDAIVGRLVMGEEHARENARAYAVPALHDAYQESTGTDRNGFFVEHQHRISNRRLLIDVAGYGGRGASGVAVQVNLNALGYEAWVREQGSPAHAPPREGEVGTGTAGQDTQSTRTPPREGDDPHDVKQP